MEQRIKANENYQPNHVPRALKVIAGQSGTERREADSDQVDGGIQVVRRSFLAIGTKHAFICEDKLVKIPQAHAAFLERLEEIPHRTGNGLMIHGIGEETGDSRLEKCRVTAEVSKLERIPDGMHAIELPETQYAYYRHRDGIHRIGDTYSKLHLWILENGDYGEGCMVEVSDEHFQVVEDDSIVHVYVPFKEKEVEGYRPYSVPQALKVIQGSFFPIKGESAMNAQGSVQTVKDLKLAAVKCVGLTNFGQLIPDAIERLVGQLEQIPNRVHPEIHFGVAPCSKSQDEQETHTYYIAVEVDDFTGVPEQFDCIEVPANKYAVVRKEIGGVGDVYGIVREYMNGQQLRKADNDQEPLAYQLEIFYETIEAYHERVTGVSEEDFVMDVCIPVIYDRNI
ncbi:GyrI-like domain-containing protein [Paenibacillus alkalitolerans]|uniref:GyrI-like domain-containing protein n=1 Tax=Paenibacillus alkalitolerans TaxID=2799335 RepID=UPI0018F54E96|nr:GyrI-like domain-containing protein [Paenibacillus alkalitolerans]